MKPMISILFEELEHLLWNLMTKFVELKYLQEEVNRKEKVFLKLVCQKYWNQWK